MFVTIGLFLALVLLGADLPALAGASALAGVMAQSVSGRLVARSTHGRARARKQTRTAASYTYREEAGELTRAELREQEQAERENYNRISPPVSFWAGSDTYPDYDGNIRDLATHEVVGHKKGRR